jgi:hypothetical protein
MTSRTDIENRARGWFPKEPTHQNATETNVETAHGSSKKVAFAVYYAINLSIVFPVLLLADYLGLSLVYKVLAGAAAAGLAGVVGNLVLKVPWRKKSRETPQE